MTITDQEDSRTAFCRAEYPRLAASMTLYTGDADLAVELAQEALARALRDWRRVTALDAPSAWTHRVAVNLANSHFRRRRYERAARACAGARVPDRWHDPDAVLHQVVVQAVAALPRRQREAVVLRFLLDLSVLSTAAHMDCSAGTVRALTSQGIARLRCHPELASLQEPRDD